MDSVVDLGAIASLPKVSIHVTVIHNDSHDLHICALRSRCRAHAGCIPGAQLSCFSHRLGNERGSPKDGRTLFSKRVMAQIRSRVRVST